MSMSFLVRGRPVWFTQPRNADAYALGRKLGNGHFNVRKIVWGRLMAVEERRDGEHIRRARLLIEKKEQA